MKIFFLGISGTFMGNLAQMAKNQGHEVLGVDDKVYPPFDGEPYAICTDYPLQ